MFNFKDYIETDIEEKKEIVNVMPTNTIARKRKYLETLNQIKNEYLGHSDSVKQFILYNYDKLLPVKSVLDNQEQIKKNKKLEQLFLLDNTLTDYYEKMGFDQYIYILMHYYDYSIDEINSTISKMVEKLQSAEINLTKKDFRFNTYSYIYMECFFDEYFIINGNYTLEHFQKIYWKCPNVFLYLVVNFRYILKKYSKELNRYIQKAFSDGLMEYGLKNSKDLVEMLEEEKKEILSTLDEDEYDIVQLSLEKTIDINYYREESKNILSDYDFFSIKAIDIENVKEKNVFLDSLNNLTKNLEEYQKFLKYQPIVDYFKKNYTPKVESKEKLVEIKKFQKDIFKLENKIVWNLGMLTNTMLSYEEFFSKELNEKQILKLDSDDKLLKQIYDLYEEYDKLYYDYKIRSVIKENTKVYDIFYLLLIYPIFARKIIKEALELSEKCEIDEVLDELRSLVFNPYKKVIMMIPLFEDNNIPQILMNGYRFENLDITEDSFEETNIKIIFERANKIFRELKIQDFVLSIDQIEFLVDVYQLKKNNKI